LTTGAALLFLCGAALGQTKLFTWTAAGGNDLFGWSVSDAGDVNDDGYPDVIVGAPDVNTDRGGARLLSGKDGSLLHKLEAGIIGDAFGRSVSAVGDLDQDGHADVIVGAPGVGAAYLISGRTGNALRILSGQPGFGSCVSGAGDVDNDGTNDVIVGNPDTGKVTVFSGATGHVLHVFAGAVPDGFGTSVSGAGDANDDGFADVMIGAPFTTNTNGIAAGNVKVFSGKDWSQLHSFDGRHEYAYFGFSLSEAGDVDQDGHTDVIVGAPSDGVSSTRTGVAYVYSGKSGAKLHTFAPAGADSYFGYSVSRARDVDGDGYPDLIVGAPLESSQVVHGGRVWVFSGKSGNVLADLSGQVIDGYFGFSVSSARDANKDGQADYIIGASGEGGGIARLYSGRDCFASWGKYGAGWPGTHGVPSFTPSDDPVLCRSIQLDFENSRGSATLGVLFTGFSQGQVPTNWGGTILVSPPWFLNTLIVPAGGAHLPVEIFCDSALCGLSAYLQALEMDPGASQGISFTRGLQLTIGGD
jgi:hypothetical protein